MSHRLAKIAFVSAVGMLSAMLFGCNGSLFNPPPANNSDSIQVKSLSPMVWGLQLGSTQKVRYVNTDTGKEIFSREFPVEAKLVDIAADGNDVWIASAGQNKIVRMSALTFTVTAEIDLGFSPQRIVAQNGLVWAAQLGTSDAPFVAKIDPATNLVVSRMLLGDYLEQAQDITIQDGKLYALVGGIFVEQIDPLMSWRQEKYVGQSMGFGFGNLALSHKFAFVTDRRFGKIIKFSRPDFGSSLTRTAMNFSIGSAIRASDSYVLVADFANPRLIHVLAIADLSEVNSITLPSTLTDWIVFNDILLGFSGGSGTMIKRNVLTGQPIQSEVSGIGLDIMSH